MPRSRESFASEQSVEQEDSDDESSSRARRARADASGTGRDEIHADVHRSSMDSSREMTPAMLLSAIRKQWPSFKLVDDACTTTHWPQENKVASQGVRGSGVRGFRYLPPEAKALCRGEPCSRRARAWREEASGWGSEYGQSAAGPADQALC